LHRRAPWWRLCAPLRLLTGGRRRGIERHQTLRATVEWSYSLLGERERTVFDRLGVFAGSFDADAASAVVGDDVIAAWDVRDALDDLATKSMIDVLDDDPAGITRFRLLETLRQYAWERLDEAGLGDDYRRRHAEHIARFAEAAGPGLEGPDEIAWVARFEAELDNLRAAVAWALDADAPEDAEAGMRIIAALSGQPFFRPSAGVGEWAGAALGRVEATSPGRRTAVLAAASWSEINEGDADLGRGLAADALRDGLPSNTPSPVWPYAAFASSWIVVGDFAAVLRVVDAGRAALDAIGADDDAQLQLYLTRVVAGVFADEPDARALADDLLARSRAAGNPSHLISALRWFAETRTPDEGQGATDALEEAVGLSLAVRTPDNVDLVQSLGLLARLRARRGERVAALGALRDAITRAHDRGNRYILLAMVLGYAVSALADLDEREFAATLGGVLTGGPLTDSMTLIPGVRAGRRVALERIEADMPSDEYDAAFARGVAMSYEEVVAYTLAEVARSSLTR
jgi:hypothetical protein